jgi:hypothetical protein
MPFLLKVSQNSTKVGHPEKYTGRREKEETEKEETEGWRRREHPLTPLMISLSFFS